MATVAEHVVRVEDAPVVVRRTRALAVVLRRQPLGAASAALIALIVLTAIFADVLAPYDPLATQPEIRLRAPSWEHLFGTDDIGRDVFSRIIHGARISLWVGLLAVGIGTAAGMVIGLLCGYCEGRLDLVFQRIMDAVLDKPEDWYVFGTSAEDYTASLKGPSPRPFITHGDMDGGFASDSTRAAKGLQEAKALPRELGTRGRCRGAGAACPSGLLRLVIQQDEIELLVLSPQPAHEEAEQVAVHDLPDPVVLLDEAAELGLGEETQARRRQRPRRGRDRPIVDDPVLAEAATRAEHVESNLAGTPEPSARMLGEKELDLPLEDHVEALAREPFRQDDGAASDVLQLARGQDHPQVSGLQSLEGNRMDDRLRVSVEIGSLHCVLLPPPACAAGSGGV
jgi:hypothetical protein